MAHGGELYPDRAQEDVHLWGTAHPTACVRPHVDVTAAQAACHSDRLNEVIYPLRVSHQISSHGQPVLPPMLGPNMAGGVRTNSHALFAEVEDI